MSAAPAAAPPTQSVELDGLPSGANEVPSRREVLDGLTDEEAAALRAAGKGNDYRPPTSRGYLEILRQNAFPGINGPLLAVSLLLLATGSLVGALLTAGPVIANIVIGIIQEARAKQKLDRIAVLTRPRATIVRAGVERAVDPSEIVLGDLVVARRGDQIVVDGALVGDERVELDEALLTGESEAIVKGPGDRALSGTAVVGGTARLVADGVGRDSVANRLLTEARRLQKDRTPLQREIVATIWAVTGLVVLAAIPVALALPTIDPAYTWNEALNAAAVLVTLVPQGLAIMVTVTYAAGALRITRLGALVQQQRAVESMSRVDTLCLDKTGTLTTQGIAFEAAEPVDLDADGPDDAGVRQLLGSFAVSGGGTDRTIRALRDALPGPALEMAEEVPFASERRWSALRLSRRAGDGAAAYVLGAPVALLPSVATSGDIVRARAAELTARGLRVLLFAEASTVAALHDAEGRPVLPGRLRPLALVSLSEELRPDAAGILAQLAGAGVHLKIVSGDDPTTVEAIGRRVGLTVDRPARSGLDLDGLDDDALGEAADEATIFGRVEPGLKARLVAALRARGHYVAMIGDGVNDLLPLRRAQLGIAMETGAPATRGAADLVLLGDAFAVLPRAVVEGQRIIAAMEATLVLLLSRTFYVVLIVAGAALLGLPFPLTVRQNSVLAFVTVGIPLVVLALWVPPRRIPEHLLGETLRISIPASLAVTALALPIYAAAAAEGASVADARTTLTTMTVLCGLGLVPLIRPSREQAGGRFLRWWAWALAGLMLLVYLAVLAIPFARDFYDLTPIPWSTVAVLVTIAVAWTVVVHALRATGVVGTAEDLLVARLLRAVHRA